MTSFLLARAVLEAASANTVSFFGQDLVEKYGWQRVVDHDNASHLNKHFSAELTHMASSKLVSLRRTILPWVWG